MRAFLAGGLTLLLFLGGPLSIFTPIPLAHLVVTRGEARKALGLAGWVALAVTGLFVVPATAPAGLGDFLSLSLPGYALKESHGWMRSLAGSLSYLGWLGAMGFVIVSTRLPRTIEGRIALWLGGSAVIWTGALSLWLMPTGMGLVSYFSTALHQIVEQFFEAGTGGGMTTEQLDFLRANQQNIEGGLLRLMPAMTLSGMLAILWVDAVLLRVWARLDQVPSALPPSHPLARPLSLWRVPDPLTWFVIGAGALYFANAYLLKVDALRWVLLNAFLVLGMIYFLHGLGIISFLLRRRLSPMLRGLVYGLVFIFFQTLGVVVVSLGFFDLWLDFRRLQTKNASP